MDSKRSPLWPVLVGLLGIVLLFIALPDNWKAWAPAALRKPRIHFGLDLAGGTQLDFRISEQEMNDQITSLGRQIDALKSAGAGSDKILVLQHQLQTTEEQKTKIVESIRMVLERRINALGVSEAVITPSYIGDEKHLLVECPGVVDTQQCIQTVGKTIQLEFKEEFTEATAEFEQGVRDRADTALRRVTVSGATLGVVGQDLGTTLGVAYSDHHWYFKDELPKGLEDALAFKPGKVLKREGSITIPEQDAQGRMTQKEISGIFLAEAIAPKTETGRVIQEAPTAFGILAAEQKLKYTPHVSAPLDAKIDPLIAGTLSSMTPGDLKTVSLDTRAAALLFLRLFVPGSGSTVATASYDELTFAGPAAKADADAALARLQSGQVVQREDAVNLRTLFFSLAPTGWKDTALTGKHFRSAGVTLDPTTNLPIVQIAFDDEGATLFQELTKRNVGKRIAIFVGGDLISAPTVQGEIAGGSAVITGSGNFDEAQKLAQDLNTGAIPAPIYLAGQNTIEATLGGEALMTSMKAALVGIVILMVYMIVLYRFLGVLADLALGVYALLFVVILKLPLFFFSSQYIVLTLAGMAGIILSIGMAVDANVLIFERTKEELRKGKLVATAVDIGFKRAWPSIRDGNASTLLTCLILFVIGTSIVRGFSITLGMGVLMSMFTAIVVTRWLIRKISHFRFAQDSYLLVGIRTPHRSQ